MPNHRLSIYLYIPYAFKDITCNIATVGHLIEYSNETMEVSLMLKGKNALVTGSAKGIGREIALALAKNGANVGINDLVYDSTSKEAIELIKPHNPSVSWHKADVGETNDIDSMFADFISEHGSIDILVNNAVTAIPKAFLEVKERDFDRVISVGLKGYFFCAQRAAKEMINSGTKGKIINISSVQAFRQWPNQLVYLSLIHI